MACPKIMAKDINKENALLEVLSSLLLTWGTILNVGQEIEMYGNH